MEHRTAHATRVLARALALAGVTLLGIASAPARAAAPLPVPATAETTAAARQIAAAHWGGEPCSAAAEIRWAHLDPGLNAMARWMQEGPGHGGPFKASECSVEFNLDVAWDWPMFCTVMTHEIGHLSGQDHQDGDLIMSPYYMGPSDECLAALPAPVEQAAPAVTAPTAGPPAKGTPMAKPRGEAKPKGRAKAKRKPKPKRRSRPTRHARSHASRAQQAPTLP